MSNLPNSIIRLVPPSLRGGYCPDSWQEFANELVCGTQAQHSASRGTTFYNFGNQSPYPPAVPPPAPCTYDLLIDVEPADTDFSAKIGWISVNTLEPASGVTEISFGASGSIDAVHTLYQTPSIERLVWPNATAIGVASGSSNTISIQEMPDLLEISFPVLQTLNRRVRVWNNPLLESIEMPSLVGVATMFGFLFFDIKGNASLTDIDIGSFTPDDSMNADFSNNALNEATVNNILARFVANPSWSVFPWDNRTLNLSGGTNAAPTGQGLIDKATLIARSATVLTN
jgi:hypothetical protein